MDYEVQRAMLVIRRAGPIAIRDMLELFPVLRHEEVTARRGFNMDSFELSYKLERRDRWDRWREEIPGINFPSEWSVAVVPPHCGAIARFRVNNYTSVYLDCYARLGYWDGPYWEVYPVNGNTARHGMSDISGLLSSIQESLDGA